MAMTKAQATTANDMGDRQLQDLLQDWDRMAPVGREFGSPDYERLEELDEARLGIYPDPSEGAFNVVIPRGFGGRTEVEVLDLSGRRVLLERVMGSGGQVIPLNLDHAPAGSYVVRMDQPYSRMADMLLDTQYYNVNDPRPYDDTGWTLGPLRNVKTVRVKEAFKTQGVIEPTEAVALPTGQQVGLDRKSVV